MRTLVQGTEGAFDDLSIRACTDMIKVRKYYKLGQISGERKADEDYSRWNDPEQCSKVIIGSIALRGSS